MFFASNVRHSIKVVNGKKTNEIVKNHQTKTCVFLGRNSDLLPAYRLSVENTFTLSTGIGQANWSKTPLLTSMSSLVFFSEETLLSVIARFISSL